MFVLFCNYDIKSVYCLRKSWIHTQDITIVMTMQPDICNKSQLSKKTRSTKNTCASRNIIYMGWCISTSNNTCTEYTALKHYFCRILGCPKTLNIVMFIVIMVYCWLESCTCVWPCSIYIMGLVFDWLVEQGGCEAMAKRNLEKVKLLYDLIDASKGFYQ